MICNTNLYPDTLTISLANFESSLVWLDSYYAGSAFSTCEYFTDQALMFPYPLSNDLCLSMNWLTIRLAPKRYFYVLSYSQKIPFHLQRREYWLMSRFKELSTEWKRRKKVVFKATIFQCTYLGFNHLGKLGLWSKIPF